MKRITFFLLSIFCFTACENEIGIENIQQTTPQITLSMPDAEEISVYSTATVSECLIDTIWVMAFNESTGNKKWVEKIPGSRIVNNGRASQLMPQLINTPNDGDLIVCIANVDPNPDTLTVSYGDINTKFRLLTNNYYYGGEHLPMYGEMKWSSSTGYTCTMIRAVAKIQVRMGTSVSDVTGNFSAENVVFNVHAAGNYGYIKPSASGAIGIPQTAPLGSFFSGDHNLIQNEGATEDKHHVYIYEYPSSRRTGFDINNPISKTDFNMSRQHLILKKNNSPAATTYYRLDFFDTKTDTFIDTKRNHHYIFTINKVRSEGYTTSDQAQRSPGGNIDYTVYITDDSKFITSNGQYAIVSSAEKVTCSVGTNTIATIRYQLPPEMSSLYSGIVNTATIEPGRAVFTLLSPTTTNSLTGSNQEIRINLTGVNMSATQESAIVFTLGNITHRIVIVPTI